MSPLRGASKRENAHCDRYRVHNPQHNCISSLIGNIENRFLSLAVNQQLDESGAYLFTAGNFRKSRTSRVCTTAKNVSEIFTDGRHRWSRICRKIDQQDSRLHPAYSHQRSRSQTKPKTERGRLATSNVNLAGFHNDFRDANQRINRIWSRHNLDEFNLLCRYMKVYFASIAFSYYCK